MGSGKRPRPKGSVKRSIHEASSSSPSVKQPLPLRAGELAASQDLVTLSRLYAQNRNTLQGYKAHEYMENKKMKIEDARSGFVQLLGRASVPDPSNHAVESRGQTKPLFRNGSTGRFIWMPGN